MRDFYLSIFNVTTAKRKGGLRNESPGVEGQPYYTTIVLQTTQDALTHHNTKVSLLNQWKHMLALQYLFCLYLVMHAL